MRPSRGTFTLSSVEGELGREGVGGGGRGKGGGGGDVGSS